MYEVNKSGLAAIAQEVSNNFNIKVFTKEMLDAINNPLKDLAKTAEAYQYFTAMYNGTNFTAPGGQVIDFSSLPKNVATQLHSDVVKVLSDYSQINVPIDNSGDTTPLLDSKGDKVSLLELIANPNDTYHVSFKVSGDDMDNAADDPKGSSPKWSDNPAGGSMYGDYENEDNHWWGSENGIGKTDHFRVGDRTKYTLDASVSPPGACSSSDEYKWSISGTATAWEDSGALNPVANSAASADATSLENYLQDNM